MSKMGQKGRNHREREGEKKDILEETEIQEMKMMM